jgi:glycosyltransferase involved in cell wall biosynthesis
MKITLIGTLPPIKALSPYCYHLAEALSKKIELEFINFNRIIPEFLYPGGTKEKKTYYQKKINSKDIISWNNPLSWIKAGRAASGDIIHIQHWQRYATFMYCFIVPILKYRKKKILISVHNITPHEKKKHIIIIDKILNLFVFHFADCFIVHNDRNRELFKKIYNVNNKKIYIIGLGVNIPQIMRKISKSKAREQLKIQNNKKVLLYFGYIWKYKGIDILLYSLEKIAKEIKDVLLVIAGQPLTNWDEYEKIIKNKDLNKFILKHLKYISEPDLEMFFSAADLIVLPYAPPFDTHGGVAAFAIGMKKPLVVSDIGGLPEFVDDKRAIVKSGDIEDLAKKIIRIFHDEELLNKLKKDSISISKEITWDSIAQKTIKVYEDMNSEC